MMSNDDSFTNIAPANNHPEAEDDHRRNKSNKVLTELNLNEPSLDKPVDKKKNRHSPSENGIKSKEDRV